MSLRVLHPYNMTAGPCGIANFAQQWSTALRRAGCAVTDWNANYSVIHAREEAQEAGTYLPADAATYDVIIIGWHPAALNTYTADHFPVESRLCVYLHDLPPWSRCPFEDRANLLVTSEPHPTRKTLVLPYPIVDWVNDLPWPNAAFTVGWTGVRGDGQAELKAACATHGWQTNFSNPAVWLSIEDEIRRLARSTVNVCWYHEGRGTSGAASTCLASGRPLLINHSLMLRHLQNGGLVRRRSGTLAEALRPLATQWHGDHYRWEWDVDAQKADLSLTERSWSAATDRLLTMWECTRP